MSQGPLILKLVIFTHFCLFTHGNIQMQYIKSSLFPSHLAEERESFRGFIFPDFFPLNHHKDRDTYIYIYIRYGLFRILYMKTFA